MSVCVCVCVCVRARARTHAHTYTHTHTHTHIHTHTHTHTHELDEVVRTPVTVVMLNDENAPLLPAENGTRATMWVGVCVCTRIREMFWQIS